MANLLTGAKRTDLHLVNPFDIIVKEDLRGRAFPPTEADIIELAISLSKHGQRQPCEVRKVGPEQYQLNYGFTRMAAARLLREGFEHNGVQYCDAEFMLKVTTLNGNDEQAFVNNVIENAHRNETSPIDDAHNQERFRDRYGKTDAEIADLYRCSVQTVQRNTRLLELSKELQLKVHLKEMSVAAALNLLDLPEAQRVAVVEVAQTDSGKIDSKTVRTKVRDHHLNDDSGGTNPGKTSKASGEAPPKAKQRTNSEVREFFSCEAKVDSPAATLARTIEQFMKGTISDAEMKSAWDAAFPQES